MSAGDSNACIQIARCPGIAIALYFLVNKSYTLKWDFRSIAFDGGWGGGGGEILPCSIFVQIWLGL